MVKRRKKFSPLSASQTEIERDVDAYMRRRARTGPSTKSAKCRTKKPVGLKRKRKKK